MEYRDIRVCTQFLYFMQYTVLYQNRRFFEEDAIFIKFAEKDNLLCLGSSKKISPISIEFRTVPYSTRF